MADTKISAAADIGTVNATDMLPVARSGSSTAYHATMDEVATFTALNLPDATASLRGVVKVDGTTILASSGVISTSAPVPPAATATPAMDSVGNAGVVTAWSRGDHVHPSDTTKAPLASPTFTGSPAAPTVTPATDSTTKLATTAFVQSAMAAAGAGVSSFNARTGAVVLSTADVATTGAFNNVGRNLLHNSGFRINQRSYVSGTALAAAAYCFDRWKAGPGGCTLTFTATPPATTITITAGTLQQIVEALDVEGGTYTLSWTGTANGRVNAGSYGASPITVTSLAANTAITVEFQTGTVGTVQLEAGSVATVYERRDLVLELQQCQRFYQVGSVDYGGYTGAGIGQHQSWAFAVPMRAVPTATQNVTGSTNVSSVGFYPNDASIMRAVGSGVAAGGFFITGTFTASADL